MYDAVLDFMSRVNTQDPLKRFIGLVGTSAALGSNVYLKNGPLGRLYPNLFFITIANPGMGKSLMADTLTLLIYRYNKRYAEIPDMQVRLTPGQFNPASLIEWSLKEEPIDVLGEPTTPFLMASSELSVLIGNSSYGNILEGMLAMYDCPPLFSKYTRQKGMEEVPRICPSFIAATTPSFWKRFMPTNLANDGFTSRTLLYHFNEFIERDGDLIWGNEQQIEVILDEITRLRSLKGIFEWDKKAYQWYIEEFTKENNKFLRKHFNGSDLWQGYANRKSDQMKKLAMCLSAARGNTLKLTLEDCKKALTHLGFVEKGLSGLLTPRDMKASSDSRSLVLQVLEKGPATSGQILAEISKAGVFILLKELEAVLLTLLADQTVVFENNLYKARVTP